MKKLILLNLLICWLVPVYSQVIPAIKVNVNQFGVKGDGTNETQKIQNALNYLTTKGGGTLYVPKGVYILSQQGKSLGLTISSNIKIKGDGVGVTIFKRADNDVKFSRLFGVKNAVNVFLEDFTVDGNKANQDQSFEQQHNFFVDNSTKITFERVENKNAVGDGIYFFIGSKNATVSNCLFNDIVRVGINCTNLDGGKITGCRFNGIITNGIKVEKNQVTLTSPSRDIYISNCSFRSNAIGTNAAGININGLPGDLVTGITISENKFANIDYCVIGLVYVDNVLVEKNIADSVKSVCRSSSYNTRRGIASGTIIIQRNILTNGFGGDNKNDMLFVFYYFKNAIVRDNVLTENSSSPYKRIALCIENNNIEFSNNKIISSGLLSGLIFNKCENIKFQGNYLKMNTPKNVFDLIDDDKINLASVTIRDNTFDGSYNYIVANADLSITKIGHGPFIDFGNNVKRGKSKGDILNIPNQFFRSKN
jgi:hypothetical protein